MKQGTPWIRKTAFKAIEKELLLWLGIFCFIWGIGRSLDYLIFDWILTWKTPWLDQLFIFLTEKGLPYSVGALVVLALWRLYHNPHHRTKLLPAVFSLFVTLVVVAILKAYFEVPRPYLALDLVPLVDITSYSFPSGHTATAFAMMIPLLRISRLIGLFWLVVALLVAFGRIYEMVHYPSDIAGGIFVGGLIGAFFSNRVLGEWILQKWEEREFRRQTFHLITGFLCVFLHWVGLLRLRYLAIILVLGLLISLISQHKKIPFISYVLERFDRPRDRDFPGRGAFYFFLSVFCIFGIFNGPYIPIAYASILILAVGDSFNHYMAPRINDVAMPWNRRKLLSGLGIGIFMGTLAAHFFVPIGVGFVASTVALLVETFDFKIGRFYLDDNLTVPLVAAFIMYFFEAGFAWQPLWSSMGFFESMF